MKYIKVPLLFFSFLFLSCFLISEKTQTGIKWLKYQESFETGFQIEFIYPENLALAGIVDNCRCFDKKNNIKYDSLGELIITPRIWLICLQDSIGYSIEDLIKSNESTINEKYKTYRDSININNVESQRITLIGETTYKQLIYLFKYSTLFELTNNKKTTSKDFEHFCESFSITPSR